MAARAKRILGTGVAGAAIGCFFVFARMVVTNDFAPDAAYGIGRIIGGGLLGFIIGAMIGAVRKSGPSGPRTEPTLRSNPVDRTEWYVHDDAGERGPLKKPEVAALLRQGLLRPESYVWRAGFTDWVPIAQVDELALSMSHAKPPHVYDKGSKARTAKRGTYIGRHWRGELSLPVSYWLNVILATAITLAAGIVGEVLISPVEFPVAYASFWIAFWSLLGLVQLWWMVGVWRSASNYAIEHPKRYWGGVAKVLMVLGGISTAGTFASQGIPQMAEFAAIIKTYNSKPSYALRILRDSTELEITGPLDFGVSRAVSNLLSDHPSIRTVHLNSEGGRLAEADALKNLILQNNLNTYVSAECASACVTVFVAGNNRWLARSARIGLHSPHFPGSTEEEIRFAAKATKAFYYSRDIKADLIERGLNTPADDLWVPDHATIFASGLATSYATERDVALSGIKLQEFDQLETQLAKVSLFAAIKAGYPDEYRLIVQQMREGFLHGRSLPELRVSVMPIVDKLYDIALPTASDEALLAFWELAWEQARVFQATDPGQCQAFLKGEGGFKLELISHLLEKEMQVGAAVLLSRGSYPDKRLTEDVTQQAFQKLFDAIEQKHGIPTDQFLLGLDFKLSAVENCRMMVLLMQEGLQLSMPDRLIVFRMIAQE